MKDNNNNNDNNKRAEDMYSTYVQKKRGNGENVEGHAILRSANQKELAS